MTPTLHTSSPTIISAIPTNIPSTLPTQTPIISSTDISSSVPTNSPSILPTIKLSSTFTPTDIPTIIPIQTPSTNATAVPTEIPSVAPTMIPSNNSEIYETEQPTIVTSKNDEDSQTNKSDDIDSLIWIIIIAVMSSCCVCILIIALITFHRTKSKSKEKESEMTANQIELSPLSKMEFNNKDDSIEIIEGPPITIDGAKAEYQIKALEQASVYIDRKKTPSNNINGEIGTHDIVPYKPVETSTPLPSNIETRIKGNTNNGVEIVYTKK